MNAITANDFDEFLSRAEISTLDQGTQGGKHLSFKPAPARTIIVHFVESDRPNYLLDMTARILDLEETWLLMPRRGTAADLELLDGSQPDKAVRFAAAQRSRLAEYLCIRPMAFGNYSMDIFVIAAVDWYQQRADACRNEELKAILVHNRDEEKEHAAMLLEWIRRNDPAFSKELTDYLFTEKPIAHK